MVKKWYRFQFLGEGGRCARPLIVTREHNFTIDYSKLLYGSPVLGWDADATVCSELPETDGVAEDVLANAFGVPIISCRLRAALESKRVGMSDVQYLPVKVFQSNGNEESNYFIMNVVSMVNALDRIHCTMLEEGDEIDQHTGLPVVTSVWSMALFARPLSSHDVIRLSEFFPPVFVNSRFRECYLSGSFTGATFDSVEVR